jgi:hypothetical protein
VSFRQVNAVGGTGSPFKHLNCRRELCNKSGVKNKMTQSNDTVFLNSLFMDFMSEPELELFLKSIDEVWTENLYERLAAAGLIRHVVSKVWNKDQHRVSMVFEYDSKEGYETCEKILAKEFGGTRREELSKFVFKVLNNRGIVLSEFTR